MSRDAVTLTPQGPAPAAGEVGVVELARFLEALEPARMGPRLSAVAGVGPRPCHVLDAKYEPGVRAIIVYECGGRLLRGDLVPDGGEDAPTTVGTVVAPGVRVRLFPSDPDLPTLPRVMDAAQLGSVLADELGIGGRSSGRQGVSCRTTLLRYRPGKRATVRVQLGGRHLVAKVYHDPAKAAAVAAESEAIMSAASGARRLRLAPTVAHVPELRAVVQREVSGTPLDVIVGALPRSLHTAAAIRQAAEALGELHALPATSARQRSVEAELRRFGQRAARIRVAAPRLGDELGRLASRLEDARSRLPEPRLGLVHGDCKPSQFLLDGPQVLLMDLDHLGVSDQATDVGTFLASLRQLGARRSFSEPPPDIEGLRATFLDAYCERCDHADRHRILWQEAVALERKALRAYARAPRSPLAGILASTAQRCLDDLRGSP